jgi:HSP20 family molecular chaperone IbpA
MHPHGNLTLDVDAALGDVARIYRSITGRDLPRDGQPVAPIPPERDARAAAEDALEQLAGQLQMQAPQLAANHHQQPVVGTAMDCWENGAWLHFFVDLPAVKAEAVQLLLEGGVLVLRAHRQREVPDSARPTALERPAGVIERRVLLPAGIDPEQIQAELRDGVLHLKVRRLDRQAEPRRIPVR